MAYDGTVPMRTIAWARINADGTGASARGCTIARSGAGVYVVTLNGGGVDSLQCQINVTFGTSCTFNVVHTSDTVKTINSFAVDGTTATDKLIQGVEVRQIALA
jgi:hypothetical protein